MDSFGIWEWTKFICCNRPFDERFDFSNKPTELYSCLSNENSISNLSAGEHFVNGISSISNNLQASGLNSAITANSHYSLEQQQQQTNQTNSNHSSPNQQQQNPIYEYNLAELALLDNQRAQQYIQQQQTRHRQANTSAKQTDTDQPTQFNDLNAAYHGEQLDEEKAPPLPPPPHPHLLKRNNYYASIYSAPPQYTEPDLNRSDFNDSLANHSLAYANPPQYTPSNVPIYGNQPIRNNLQADELTNGHSAANNSLIHNSSGINKNLNSNYSNHHHHHHHLPHHPNQNSILTSMDGLRVQLNKTKKQMAAVANSASQLNSSHLNQSGQSTASAAVSNVAQNLVSNLVANQPIRAPQIQRTENMKVSLKGFLYRLEGAGLKQWKRRWFVLGEYCLFYYKDSQEQKMMGSVLLPSYKVSSCSTTEDGIARKFAFKLEHQNLKTHYLAAECIETQSQWMRLINLSATMQLNPANYEQLTEGTLSSALTAANISRNRPDSDMIMNKILNSRTVNNNENNKNFSNTQDLDVVDQFNSTIGSNQTNTSSLSTNPFYNDQRKDSSNLDNLDNQDELKLNDSGSESCGFTNYKSRRQSKTSELEASVNSAQMNAYNSIGLPTTNNGNYSIYSSSNSAHSKSAGNVNQINQQQFVNKMQQPTGPTKRSHYVNAPPKPRRHQAAAQQVNGNNLDQDFIQEPSSSHLNGNGNMATYGTNANLNKSFINNQPDIIDSNGYHHDLYSIPPTHRPPQIPNENLYVQHRRQTLTRQNASDSGRVTPMDTLPNNNQQSNYDNNLQIKNRPKSSQENQFDANHQFNNNNLNAQLEQMNSPQYRPWSDFIFNQQAQRSQSTTPLSTKQNQLPPTTNNHAFNHTTPVNSNLTNPLSTQSTSHAQLNNMLTKANRYEEEHAKPQFFSSGHLNNNLRASSPDYMNIEFFKQQQQNQALQPNVPKEFSPQPNHLMQKLDIDIEEQEKIYQSVLSKHARLEIENLKNEVAKQKQQLKEKQQQQNLQNQSIKENTDDSKLSNLSNEFTEDLMPPPLNLTARSIQRRDSERSARLAQAEKNDDKEILNTKEVEEKSDNEQTTTDVTDEEDSDEINLSPNPFSRSQFRRSFMNAVYTQKPHNLASYHASHAYCGPIDNNVEDKENESKNDDSKADEIIPSQLTMKQRKEQLQRLLHSDPSLESDNNKLNEDLLENQQPKAVKPPRNTFKLTKDCFLKAEEKVRATPAIIVATPDKSQIIEEDEELNKSISKQINQNIDQVNQVKKQLAFDLIEPIMIATKPPRPNMISKKKKQIEVEQPLIENVERLNIKNRIRLIEQQQQDSSDSLSSNCSLPKEKTDGINLKNRLRSSSLTLICESKKEQQRVNGGKQRRRSLSGQNLNSINHTDKNNANRPKMSLETLENLKTNDCVDKAQLTENELIKEKEQSSPTNEDEKDNGYLTMKSELSSNDETEEVQSLSPPVEKEQESKDEPCEKVNQMSENVNFDDVFSAVKPPNSDEDADDEQSLTITTSSKDQTNQTEMEIEEDDNRKTVDDQFAIYSGLSTIKKAPPNYQNTRRTKNDFKLTSALIDQQQTNFKPSTSTIQPSSHIVEQLNNLKLNSIQQQIDQLSCNYYKPQQIVSSSLINCGGLSCAFVSDPVNPEMMDANPAYETFDGVLYGQSCLVAEEDTQEAKKQEELFEKEGNKDEKCVSSEDGQTNNFKINKVEKQVLSSNSQCNAPYYYSDLLSEEQELELAKANENRPALLSRCTGLNNSRNLGTTSLPKLKNINNSQEKIDLNDQNDTNHTELSDDTNTSVKQPSNVLNGDSNNELKDEVNLSSNKLNNQQNISNSMSEYEQDTQPIDDDPVYENVNRFNCTPQSTRSSIDLNAQGNMESETKDEESQQPSSNKVVDQTSETDPEDDHLNENALRRASQNYIKQNAKVQKPIIKLNNQLNQEENKASMQNTPITPSKLNNTINNPINRTSLSQLRSPTVPGYASGDTEQPILINDDYKPTKQSSDNSINTLNNNQVPNKLTWKPNLISHSSSNLNSNKIKPNNLMNYYEGSTNSLSSSLTSSAQSLTNQTNDINASNQYHRQQSAPNLTNNFINNNLFNNHGSNLNNTEKCLANKQFNINKNINKINNLLNTPINGQDYVVYENADAERGYLITLQKQLQQQQQLLLQQQEQLAQLQRQQQQQQIKQQHYIRNEYYDNNQPPLPAYSSSSSSTSSLLNNNNSSSIVNENTVPFEHHLKNLQNVSIIQNEKTTSYASNGVHSLGKSGRKKVNKSRKSQDDNMRLMLQPNNFSELNDNSRCYMTDEDVKPPLPPLPLCYHKQSNDLNGSNQIYEKTYGEKNSNSIAKQHLNTTQNNKVSQQPIYAPSETMLNLEHQNRLMYQRQLSKSVGDNLQQSKPKFNTLDNKNRILRPCLSAGDLLGKTHEELILLLIQLKRNQSQLSNTIDSLRLQMESEDRLSTIEPHKIAEHKLKYEQVKEKLIETQNQYESQFPLIDLIDNMVRFSSNSNSNLKSNLNYGNNLNTNMNSFSTNNVYTLTSSDKNNSEIYSTNIVAAKATSTSYLNHLESMENSNELQKRVMNDESDYAGESEKNNLESTYTNRSSCSVGGTLDQLNEINSERNQDQSISRTLEIPSYSKSTTFNKNSQSNKLSDHQASNSQTTNTLSSVIVTSVKQLQTKSSNLNLQANQQNSIHQSFSKSKAVLAEEEMERMKKQQKDLEKELERVRNLLLSSQLNLPQDKNLNDDLSTTENHFQLELESIDKEINNLNAKKEKLIQNLKYKKEDKDKFKDDLFANFRSRDNLGDKFNNLEDGTDLFTDDDAIFSTVNSIDFERVLDDENGLSLCTDVDELTAHENEYVQSLKAEHEQNLKQQEEERKKQEEIRERKQLGQIKSTTNNDDETTTETTIYKTLRVKRKYENSKLNKQSTLNSGDLLRIDNVENNKNNKNMSNNQVLPALTKIDSHLNGKLKIKNDDKQKDESDLLQANGVTKNTKNSKLNGNNDLIGQAPLDDQLLPSEISQLLLDSALILYEQLKPKRSTGSSVSSERSITDLNDEQSDDEVLGDVIGSAQQTANTNNIIKQQPKVSNNILPSISASIPTLLDLNKDLTRDLNRTIDREISNVHHSGKLSNNHHFRSPSNLIDNKRLMRELMFDAEYGFTRQNDSKIPTVPKPKIVNGRSNKVSKKKSDKSGYASNIELEEERTRIY